MSSSRAIHALLALVLLAAFAMRSSVSASDPGSGDWPMGGGTPDRNMVSAMKGLPTGRAIKTKTHGKWSAQRG